jgi:hypothetical protein
MKAVLACGIAADMVQLQDNAQWLLRAAHAVRNGRMPSAEDGAASSPVDRLLMAEPIKGALAFHETGLDLMGGLLATLPAANDSPSDPSKGPAHPLGPFSA